MKKWIIIAVVIIAAVGDFKLARGNISELNLNAVPYLKLESTF